MKKYLNGKVLSKVIKYLILILFPVLLLTHDGIYRKRTHYCSEVSFGDEKLKNIHDEFIQDCIRFGKGEKIKQKNLCIMDYCDLPGRYVGISVPADRMILIDTLEMVSSYEYLYVVSYHELSHYYLDNGHESCNMCIMMPVITLRQALLIYYNRERYKKRLFK